MRLRALRVISVFIFAGLIYSATDSFASSSNATTTRVSCYASHLLEKLYAVPTRELPFDADFEQIKASYRKLLSAKGNSGKPQIDARRLINAEDWPLAVASHSTKPWTYYGRNTMADWLNGLRFINRNADGTPLSVDLLRKIHRTVSEHLPFHGFEGRRIRKLYDEGKISKDEFKELLRQAYKENKEVSGVSHAQFRGRFRTDDIDQISHNGSSVDANGSRFFTKRELNAIRGNSYMTVDERSVRQIGPDAFSAQAFYHNVHHVEAATRRIIDEATRNLAQAPSVETEIRIILQMQKDLMSIHPFLDGNGRSVRLMCDLLYQRIGLPPPLRPNEADLTLSIDEAYEYTRANMIDYINEWVLHYNQIERNAR